jgi:hypothetical protein
MFKYFILTLITQVISYNLNDIVYFFSVDAGIIIKNNNNYVNITSFDDFIANDFSNGYSDVNFTMNYDIHGDASFLYMGGRLHAQVTEYLNLVNN